MAPSLLTYSVEQTKTDQYVSKESNIISHLEVSESGVFPILYSD